MTKYIATTTGFLLPENSDYEVVKKSPTELYQGTVMKGSFTSVRDVNEDFFAENNISRSTKANALYKAYQISKSFDDYMEMVDFVTRIFKEVSVYEFFAAQASSKHISKLSLMFCKDTLQFNYKDYLKYLSFTSDSLFVKDNLISPYKAELTYRGFFSKKPEVSFKPAVQLRSGHQWDLAVCEARSDSLKWVDVLSPMIADGGAFTVFFKHIFVDD